MGRRRYRIAQSVSFCETSPWENGREMLVTGVRRTSGSTGVSSMGSACEGSCSLADNARLSCNCASRIKDIRSEMRRRRAACNFQ